ncbi:MAG: DUF371 domain-containing protein [archaeon]
MIFHIFGHPNVMATHNTTFEFTKDQNLSPKGDCIIGVRADFTPEDILRLLKKEEIKIIITVDDLKEEITALVNKDFSDEHEIVIRIGEHASKRTLGLRADKAAIHLDRKMIEKLKNPETVGRVEIR